MFPPDMLNTLSPSHSGIYNLDSISDCFNRVEFDIGHIEHQHQANGNQCCTG